MINAIPLALYAMKDAIRRPVSSTMVAVSLVVILGLLGGAILTLQGVNRAAQVTVSSIPQLIIRTSSTPLSNHLIVKIAALPGVLSVTKEPFRSLSEFGRELINPLGDNDGDVGVSVFHDGEALALADEIQGIVGEQEIQLLTSGELARRVTAHIFRLGTSFLVFMIPVVFGLLLLVYSTLVERRLAKRESGLLKLLGWTTKDILVFHIWRALFVGTPGVLFGVIAAAALVYSSSLNWFREAFTPTLTSLPTLQFDSMDFLVFAAVAVGFVLLPWFFAAVLPALRSGLEDPMDLIKGA